MKKVLFISYDYPPSTPPGAQRAKVFCQTLLQNDIEPIVLTSSLNAQKSCDEEASKYSYRIERVKSVDALGILSIGGRSFSWFALPDRWWPWIITGYRKGLSLIKTNDIDLVMVTIPTYSAGVMAWLLSKRSGLPLIVDLRDPFRFRYDPGNVPAHFLYKFIESKIIEKAHKVITTTNECSSYYSKLYPHIEPSKFIHIANGFDEEKFSDVVCERTEKVKKFTLLHSGTLYSIGRDPKPLLIAISLLKKKNIICSNTFQLVVRGSSAWPKLQRSLLELSIEDLVIFKEMTSYSASLVEMRKSNALVIIQGDMFKNQVPSKLYDCLACCRPILVTAKPKSATGLEAARLGISMVSDLPDDLVAMLEKIIKGQGKIMSDIDLESRQEKSKAIIHIVNQVIGVENGN